MLHIIYLCITPLSWIFMDPAPQSQLAAINEKRYDRESLDGGQWRGTGETPVHRDVHEPSLIPYSSTLQVYLGFWLCHCRSFKWYKVRLINFLLRDPEILIKAFQFWTSSKLIHLSPMFTCISVNNIISVHKTCD